MQATVTPTQFNVVHDFTPFPTGTRRTSPVHWAEILTTRPPSPWPYRLLLSYINPFCLFLKLSCWNSPSCASGIRYQSFSSILYATTFVSQSDSSNVKVHLFSQSDPDDVTLGSSRRASILRGSCSNTLSLLYTQGWSNTLAPWRANCMQANQLVKYQSDRRSSSRPPVFKIILSGIVQRRESKS